MWHKMGNKNKIGGIVMKDLLLLYEKFYNKFEEILKSNPDSCSVCPFEKQCSIYKNPRDSYICDDLEYLMEVLIENISNEGVKDEMEE